VTKLLGRSTGCNGRGHTLTLRGDEERIGANVGVLQGDTLAPYLFVLVVDALLRRLLKFKGVADPGKKLLSEIRFLAFADDIMLCSSSMDELQKMFLQLQRDAEVVGLKVNFGKAKTECFSAGSPLECDLRNLAGEKIPVTDAYKYLGAKVLDMDADLRSMKGKCWALYTRYKYVWKAPIAKATKRRLFETLIVPVMTYSAHAHVLTSAQADAFDSFHARMLRACLGLPPAFVSRAIMHTEDLYDGAWFLSARLRKARVHFVGKLWREQAKGHRIHPLVTILSWDMTDHKRISRRRTLREQLLLDVRVQDPVQLDTVFSTPKRITQAGLDAGSRAQARRTAAIATRRAAEQFRHWKEELRRWLRAPPT
jgi:hypothetical protein